MKRFVPFRRTLTPLLVLAMLCTLVLPASAFFWNRSGSAPYVADFSKNGLIGTIIAFDPKDFVVKTNNKAQLNSITIRSIPDPGAGTLVIGGRPVAVDSVIDSTALGGLRFQASQNPTITTTAFTFTPSFS
ncbi:MAG: S-layer homology domain-containing protein, partial [Lawsonibacter sp.]|nr:S-layer homology domain-containing protein [Lawsonibacter sp.]